MAYLDEEIASQPDCWHKAAALAIQAADALPRIRATSPDR